MSADLLRRAAEKLRQHAEAATPGPWNASPVRSPDSHATSAVYSFAHPTGTSASEVVASRAVRHYGPVIRPDDAEYVALLHPPVALALADLLERIYVAPRVAVMPSVREYAESVARAILREDA